MTIKLTLSVVSHGHGEMLGDLLGDLRRYAPDATVIVTFNIPEDSFDRTLWPNVIFRDNPAPKGFGANHNAALADAVTPWLVVINPDIRLTEHSLPGIVSAIADRPAVAMWAPRVVGPDGEVQDSARALPSPLRVSSRVLRRIANLAPPIGSDDHPTWFAGMFLMIRRTAFEDIGGFDERYFLYGEDVALSIAMVARGNPIGLAQDSLVIHDARRATLKSLRHLRWHCSSLVRLWLSPSFYRHERRFSALERQA